MRRRCDLAHPYSSHRSPLIAAPAPAFPGYGLTRAAPDGGHGVDCTVLHSPSRQFILTTNRTPPAHLVRICIVFHHKIVVANTVLVLLVAPAPLKVATHDHARTQGQVQGGTRAFGHEHDELNQARTMQPPTPAEADIHESDPRSLLPVLLHPLPLASRRPCRLQE